MERPGALTGSCLCGAVKFTVGAVPEAPVACHCAQCRRQSGHYFASANVARSALTVSGEESLSWYQSSAKVRRGFCGHCGSSLFWDPPARDWISVAMGALDRPTRLALERQIFVADKGDYYTIADGLPQNEHWPCGRVMSAPGRSTAALARAAGGAGASAGSCACLIPLRTGRDSFERLREDRPASCAAGPGFGFGRCSMKQIGVFDARCSRRMAFMEIIRAGAASFRRDRDVARTPPRRRGICREDC